MSDNPYANDYNDGYGPEDAPPRTSALAITSLVMSLICCIPVVPLLGAGLGVGALIGIGGSGGRVGGRGMAVAGIIIGVLVTIAQGAFLLMGYQGMNMASQMLYGSADNFMTQVEGQDYDAARAAVTGPVSQVSDEQLTVWRDGYQAAYGSFVDIPTDWSGIFQAYAALGQQMQNYQGQQNIIPIPAVFDNGTVLMLGQIDPAAQPAQTPQGAPQLPIVDFWIVMPDGSELRLSGQGGAVPAPAPVPDAVPDPDAETGEQPGTPEPDGP